MGGQTLVGLVRLTLGTRVSTKADLRFVWHGACTVDQLHAFDLLHRATDPPAIAYRPCDEPGAVIRIETQAFHQCEAPVIFTLCQ
jgi:hypothetical protein